MDKKVLAAIVDSIVAGTAAKAGIDEMEARTLVGIALRKNVETLSDRLAGVLGHAVEQPIV